MSSDEPADPAQRMPPDRRTGAAGGLADPDAEGFEPGERGGGAGRPSWVQRLRAGYARPANRFLIHFLPLLAVSALAYPWLAERFPGLVQGLIRLTAAIEFGLFDLVSDQVSLRDQLVVFGPFAVKIVDECTGLFEMVIFSAAVLAFPASLRDRVLGLLLGNPLIYVFNLVRIAGLIWVGRYYPPLFEFMHLYFWQATMVAMITSVWLLWLVKVVKRVENTAPIAA